MLEQRTHRCRTEGNRIEKEAIPAFGVVTLLERLKIALVYVLPVVKPKLYLPMARRFVGKYMEFPTGTTDHELYVCVNGGAVTQSHRELFYPIVPTFISHDNTGQDIGAYQMAAQTIQCDLLMCIGTPVRPCVVGWLDWIVKGVQEHGPGLYGPWAFHVPAPHIRTTLFWTQPEILNSYPNPVETGARYEFEFGKNSMTRHCMKMGLPALQVTAYGVFRMEQWHFVEREEAVFEDQHTDKVYL